MKSVLRKNCLFIVTLFIVAISFGGCSNPNEITIWTDNEDPKIQFAVEEIIKSFDKDEIRAKKAQDENAGINFIVQKDNEEIKPEGFQIKKAKDNRIEVVASGAAGAMYGGLELAEQIKLYGIEGVKGVNQNPYMEMRGTKFNIPLDVRTPSYSDASDAAQKNMPEMWNFDFWKEYIDNLARYRYNFISLWNLHPFPSMVKVPDYPDVALDDVLRSTGEWDEYYHTWAIGLDTPEILDHTEVIKRITIDEKIEFWQKVMAYAHDRNIRFYMVTWNIFVNGTEGKYGITDQIDNAVTRDYFRESVKQMFVTYPLLAGIGITTGENMHGIPVMEKEAWIFDTYGQAVLEAARDMPNRDFLFIHRQHQTKVKEIAEMFQPLTRVDNIDFVFSFKYAQAHVMSATKQPHVDDFAKDIEGMKTLWTMRNDDNYFFRWGAPDFVREFIENIPYEPTLGFYYGSDNYIWGRDFFSKQSESSRQLDIVKHWYHWMMWGRFGYNPELTNDRLIAMLQYRYPEVDAETLFNVWQTASMIYPTTTAFHWGRIDLLWFIEGCRSRPGWPKIVTVTGFHDVNVFINYPVHAYSGCISIPDYVNVVINKESTNLNTPLDVAQTLHAHADKSIELLEQLESENQSQELKFTLHDIRTMAAMGKYYAHKIAGSTNVALYRETKDKKYQEKAIAELTKALECWEKYTELAMKQNINPLWTNRVGYVDWIKTAEWVKQDIEIAKQN